MASQSRRIWPSFAPVANRDGTAIGDGAVSREGTASPGATGRLLRAVERVARDLGNTPAVCRRCYIHPTIIDAYLDGSMAQVVRRRAGRKLKESSGALQPEEQGVLRLIRDRLAETGPSANSSAA